MKFALALTAFLAALFCTPTLAHSQSLPLDFRAGYVTDTDLNGDGIALGVGMGAGPFRIGLDGSHFESDGIERTMIGPSFEIAPSTGILRPFAGIGFHYADAQQGTIDADGYGWNARAGLLAHITDSLALEASYQHERSELDGDVDVTLEGDTLMLGVRVR